MCVGDSSRRCEEIVKNLEQRKKSQTAPLNAIIIIIIINAKCCTHVELQIEHENTRTEYFHTDSMSDLLGWLADLQMMAIMNKNTG